MCNSQPVQQIHVRPPSSTGASWSGIHAGQGDSSSSAMIIGASSYATGTAPATTAAVTAAGATAAAALEVDALGCLGFLGLDVLSVGAGAAAIETVCSPSIGRAAGSNRSVVCAALVAGADEDEEESAEPTSPEGEAVAAAAATLADTRFGRLAGIAAFFVASEGEGERRRAAGEASSVGGSDVVAVVAGTAAGGGGGVAGDVVAELADGTTEEAVRTMASTVCGGCGSWPDMTGGWSGEVGCRRVLREETL